MEYQWEVIMWYASLIWNMKHFSDIWLFLCWSVSSYSSLYRILRLGGGSREHGGGTFSLEKSNISHFFKLENFQKMLKKQWKFYTFLKIYMKNFAIFENFLKFYRNFRENLGKILGIWICRGFGGRSPSKLAKILKK